MPARGLILLTVLSTAALAVLLGLGLWQLRRLQWKAGLIARSRRVKAEPAR
jgi:surfeit locus 1 family protein